MAFQRMGSGSGGGTPTITIDGSVTFTAYTGNISNLQEGKTYMVLSGCPDSNQSIASGGTELFKMLVRVGSAYGYIIIFTANSTTVTLSSGRSNNGYSVALIE